MRTARLIRIDHDLAIVRAQHRAVKRELAWNSVQLFWYQGYGPVLMAATVAFLASRVL